MHVPRWLAWRYLFSPALTGPIAVITRISALGIGVGAAVLVLALSVFNGFHTLLQGLFAEFDADLRVVAAQGPHLPLSDSLQQGLLAMPNVAGLSYTLECKAVLGYPGSDKRHIVRLVGVPPSFSDVSRAHTLVYVGTFDLSPRPIPQVVLGSGVAYYTRASLYSDRSLELFTLAGDADLAQNPAAALRSLAVRPAGYFSLQKEYDDHLVLVDYAAARDFLQQPGRVSSYQLRLRPGTDPQTAAQAIEARYPGLRALPWYAQHQSLYEVMRNEKYVAYLVITFMLLLASTNIVGSLTMIVIEKKRDIAMLQALGATPRQIRALFVWEGVWLGGLAGLLGTGLGLGLAWVQQTFGLLKLGTGGSFLIDAYPATPSLWDAAAVLLTVVALAMLSSLYPAWRAAHVVPATQLRSAGA
jgi:lipoprotein-releasing system permease protein